MYTYLATELRTLQAMEQYVSDERWMDTPQAEHERQFLGCSDVSDGDLGLMSTTLSSLIMYDCMHRNPTIIWKENQITKDHFDYPLTNQLSNPRQCVKSSDFSLSNTSTIDIVLHSSFQIVLFMSE